MKAFIMGADETLQLRWVEKVRTLGWDIERIGGVSREANPQGISIPTETELLVILKDQISHKVRDKFKAEADLSGLVTLEVSSKVSMAVSALVTHSEHIPRIWEHPEEIEADDAKERFGAEDNEGGLLIIPFDCAWDSLRWDRNYSGSSKRLAKNWVRYCREHDVPFMHYTSDGTESVQLGQMVLPPTSRLSECYNPLTIITDKIKSCQSVSKLYATHWLLGASDDDYVFKSRHEIDRALRMTFGITSRNLEESLWVDLIENTPKRKSSKPSQPERTLSWEEKHPRVSLSESFISINGIRIDAEELHLPAQSREDLKTVLSSIELNGSFIVRVNTYESDYFVKVKRSSSRSNLQLQYVEDLIGMKPSRLSESFIILNGTDSPSAEDYSDTDPTKPKVSVTVFSDTKTVLRVI